MIMKKNIYFYGITAIAAVFMVSCGGRTHKEPTAKDLLTAKGWNVVEIVTPDTIVNLMPERGAWIVFSDSTSQISGNGGCNTFMGTFDAPTDSTIVITPLGATMMLCDDMEFEGLYMQSLPLVTRFVVTDNTLTLTGADGLTLRFDGQETAAQ